jgi:NAD(P)-dependent dehydrogenase (short-subunit alcohol dehydrogenase family)
MQAVVLGARNLGGAIAAHLVASGWRAAAVARSSDSLAGLADGVVGLQADASDPDALRDALARAREELGGLTLIVNAVSASRPARPDGPFGGGPLRDADLADFRGWGTAVAEQAFVFLSEGARALTGGGTLIQVTGGSSRRAMPGRGIWSAGAQATRALTQAAAIELADDGIHAALLIVDATIDSPKTAAFIGDQPSDATASMDDVAGAVSFLAGQTPRAWTHELVVTPRLDRWVP